MTKDVIFTVPTKEEPFRTYYAERNGGVAKHLAQILGYPFVGLVEELKFDDCYIISPKTIAKAEMKKMGIGGESDFYGLAISDPALVDKQILHLGGLGTDNCFAEEVRGEVLSGFRVRGSKELRLATKTIIEEHGEARIKKLGVSDGRGQIIVTENNQLGSLEIGRGEEVVVEPNLTGKATISVGSVILGIHEYGFISHQTNDIAGDDKRDRYTGANPVRVIRGGIENLIELNLSQNENVAVQKAILFDHVYRRRFTPVASRLSYDILFGKDANGRQLVGVTDITGRLGGTCPALVLAIQELINTDAREVGARVALNYTTEDKSTDASVIFLDHKTLRITAELLKGQI